METYPYKHIYLQETLLKLFVIIYLKLSKPLCMILSELIVCLLSPNFAVTYYNYYRKRNYGSHTLLLSVARRDSLR